MKRLKQSIIILVVALVAFVFGYEVGFAGLTLKPIQHIVHITAEWFFTQATIERPVNDTVIVVNLRWYQSIQGSSFHYEEKRFAVDECALVLVDVSEGNPQGVEFDAILDVLEAGRENGMLIIHGIGYGEFPSSISPLPGEIVLDYYNLIPDDKEMHIALLRHGIKTLFYTGYHTDECLVRRPYGIRRMEGLGYQIILLRDCTATLEYPDTVDEMWATELAVRKIEGRENSYSCTSADFISGFSPPVRGREE